MQPYEYKHVNRKGQTEERKIIMRRLFGRFATSKEKLMGKLSVDHLEELFEKSNLIWNAEAEKN